MTIPARGLPRSEFSGRVSRAQALMGKAGLDALLLTTEADIRYVTGFLTRFWESPTRPWYVILPAAGAPIAVIPSIGAALMSRTWITGIRTWRAPAPEDDGVTLLAESLLEVTGASGKIGVPMALESHLRMPLADWQRLQELLPRVVMQSDNGILRDLRMIKSEAEIAKIRAACQIADRAFARVPEIARAGVPLDQVFRQFQMLCLQEGADWVPYLAGGAGQGGYEDVISPARDAPLRPGDILMLDTGVMWDGYFCDFDRNYSVGVPSRGAAAAHGRLLDAVGAAMDVARAGATAADLFHAMDAVLTGGQGGGDAGRLGHGLGMQLTEGVSLIPEDQTVLKAGMVITLEPGISLPDGKIMVHEEDIVIRADSAELLSTPAPREIMRLEG